MGHILAWVATCTNTTVIISPHDVYTWGDEKLTVTKHHWLYLLYSNWPISIMVRVFANGLGDQGSIPGQVIPKTQKMILDVALLNTQHYKVQIKGKWSNPGKGVAPSPTLWWSSNWKGSIQVVFNNGLTTYFIYIYIYMHYSLQLNRSRE